jgi:hypothetical protein
MDARHDDICGHAIKKLLETVCWEYLGVRLNHLTEVVVHHRDNLDGSILTTFH